MRCIFRLLQLIGVVTNLLSLWLVGLIFPGVIVSCILAAVWPGAASIMVGVVGFGIRILLRFVALLAEFPLAAIYTKSIFVVIWICLGYGMILLFLLAKKKRASGLVCACVIELCLALLLSWMVPRSCNVHMTVLDVGQGQCVILTAKGRTFVIDCGGDYDEDVADMAAETLLSQGIYRIDGLILTHFDRDHAGGAAYFLSRIRADKVFMPPGNENEALADLEYAYFVQSDVQMQWQGCVMQIFAPVLANSDNESGISVLFSGENCDILITGDMSTLGEALLLSGKQLPKLEALVVGHHGSKNSTSDKLLEATMPEVAMISVGENSYGHPTDEVLRRLEKCGCQVRRTDIEGTIVFRR